MSFTGKMLMIQRRGSSKIEPVPALPENVHCEVHGLVLLERQQVPVSFESLVALNNWLKVNRVSMRMPIQGELLTLTIN